MTLTYLLTYDTDDIETWRHKHEAASSRMGGVLHT